VLPPPTRTDRIGLKFLQYYPGHRVFHPGVDYNWGPSADSDKGQPVITPASGVVVYVSPVGTNGGLGNYLVLGHPQFGVWTRFLHLEDAVVRKGKKLSQEELVARLGDSGTTSAHLHFEVLNAKGFAFVRDWHRPFGRYPTGLSKQSVASMWLDPTLWLRSNTETPAVLRRGERRLAREARG
jgi:murein DD-endopeptidase MepM/ murein hydrolase activator NlpD